MASAKRVPFSVAFWFLLGAVTVGTITIALHLEWTEWHLSALTAVLVALYLHHYFSNFAKLPAVFCKNGTPLGRILVDHVPTLTRPYRPPLWCAESRLLTLVRYFVPCMSKLKWQREVVEAREGGQFYIDWCHNEDSIKFPQPHTRPTAIIVPGLTSTTKSNYIKSIANRLAERGFRIVVLIYRGLEGMELLTPKTYCATHTIDLNQTVEHLQQRFPKSRLYGVGASLGSLILSRYLSEQGDDSVIEAGILFSCPFNPIDCIKELETFSNRWLMNVHVTQNLKRQYRRNSHMFESIVDHEKIEKVVFLREFDHHFTSPVFGYKNTEEYYEDAALNAEKMRKIKVPLLCVGSSDDPFSPEWALPKEEITQTENVALVMTYGGGHVSHLQMFFPFTKSYFEHILEEYFDAVTK